MPTTPVETETTTVAPALEEIAPATLVSRIKYEGGVMTIPIKEGNEYTATSDAGLTITNELQQIFNEGTGAKFTPVIDEDGKVTGFQSDINSKEAQTIAEEIKSRINKLTETPAPEIPTPVAPAPAAPATDKITELNPGDVITLTNKDGKTFTLGVIGLEEGKLELVSLGDRTPKAAYLEALNDKLADGQVDAVKASLNKHDVKIEGVDKQAELLEDLLKGNAASLKKNEPMIVALIEKVLTDDSVGEKQNTIIKLVNKTDKVIGDDNQPFIDAVNKAMGGPEVSKDKPAQTAAEPSSHLETIKGLIAEVKEESIDKIEGADVKGTGKTASHKALLEAIDAAFIDENAGPKVMNDIAKALKGVPEEIKTDVRKHWNKARSESEYDMEGITRFQEEPRTVTKSKSVSLEDLYAQREDRRFDKEEKKLHKKEVKEAVGLGVAGGVGLLLTAVCPLVGIPVLAAVVIGAICKNSANNEKREDIALDRAIAKAERNEGVRGR